MTNFGQWKAGIDSSAPTGGWESPPAGYPGLLQRADPWYLSKPPIPGFALCCLLSLRNPAGPLVQLHSLIQSQIIKYMQLACDIWITMLSKLDEEQPWIPAQTVQSADAAFNSSPTSLPCCFVLFYFTKSNRCTHFLGISEQFPEGHHWTATALQQIFFSSPSTNPVPAAPQAMLSPRGNQKVHRWAHRGGEGHQTEPQPQIHLLNVSTLCSVAPAAAHLPQDPTSPALDAESLSHRTVWSQGN